MNFLRNIILTAVLVSGFFTVNAQQITIEGNQCVGDTLYFSHDVNNYDYNRWYFGDGKDSYWDEPEHVYFQDSTYTISLVIVYSNNDKDSVSTTLSIGEPPNLELEYGDADWTIYEGQETTIKATGDDFASVEWFRLGTSLTTSETVVVDEEGYYDVIVMDENGCSTSKRSDSLIVKPPLDENENIIEVVNNVITPNGDGFNDFLIIKDRADYANPIIISIYNVWGDKVYESSNYNTEQWKAEGLDAGTYYYHIVSEGKQGVTGFVDVIK